MRGRLLTSILPGLVIVACFLVAFTVRRPDSGVDVRAVACCPDRVLEAAVSVRRAGRREVLAGTRTDAGGRARLLLEPGRYVIRGAAGRRLRARRVEVFVRDGAFARATVRFRARR